MGAYFGHSNDIFLCQTSGGNEDITALFRNSFGQESWDELSIEFAKFVHTLRRGKRP